MLNRQHPQIAGSRYARSCQAIPKRTDLGAGGLVQRRLSTTPHPLRHTVAFVRQRGG